MRIVKEFLHAFQQYYKDGTNGTMDCRWYAAYYILVNLGLYILTSCTLSAMIYKLATMYFIITATIVLLVEPYKEEYAIYSIVDCVQYLWLALFSSLIAFMNFSSLLERELLVYSYCLSIGIGTVPLLYITTLVIYKIGKRNGLKFCNKETVLNESLPDRLYNPNQYKDSCGYVPIYKQT